MPETGNENASYKSYPFLSVDRLQSDKFFQIFRNLRARHWALLAAQFEYFIFKWRKTWLIWLSTHI